MKYSYLFLIAACQLPHVPSHARNNAQEQASIALVTMDCGEEDPFNKTDLGWHGPDIDYGSEVGTGVIISENRILTVAHLVGCPTVPNVHVSLTNGRVMMVNVERDAKMFGNGSDLARLELASADVFHLDISPPALSEPSGLLCAWTTRGEVCGPVLTIGLQDFTFAAKTRPGDSGAGVYDLAGHLIGLVTGGSRDSSSGVRVDASWLEGT